MTPRPTVAYTDGACIGNPGPGGWAWVVDGGGYRSGAEAASTNQRMEVQAVLDAVRSIPGELTIVSDSTYVVKCFNDRWYEGWERRGWKNASKQPVANQDLWRPLVGLYLERAHEITFRWVKGHSGDRFNDVADRLATEAARTQQGRAGDDEPTDLGAPDDPTAGHADRHTAGAAPSAAAAPTEPGIAGWKVAAFGHRPPQLGGYDPDNPIAAGVTRQLAAVLDGWRAVHPDIVVLTGLGLGAEQLAATVCLDLAVPYVAVLPYPDPDKVWPATSRARYAELVAGARSTILLDRNAPATKQAAGRAAGARDRWIIGTANAGVVVWDGQDRGLGELVAAMERKDLDVFPLTPAG